MILSSTLKRKNNMTNTYIKIGSKFQLFNAPVTILEKLPAGAYLVQFHPLEGYSLIETEKFTDTVGKLYGNHPQKINRIIRKFSQSNEPLGAMFTGDKGMGKSVAVREIAYRVINEMELPVIIVNKNTPGLVDFLDTIEQAVFIFDEFEKVFPLEDNEETDLPNQDQFLNFFDGLSTTKRLYLLTANDDDDLSDYLINRPGRFHYHIQFDYPNADAVREYLQDNAPQASLEEIEKVVDFSLKTKVNYDHLRAIAEEFSFSNKFHEFIEDLNIKNSENVEFIFKVKFSDGSTYTRDIFLDVFDEDSSSVYVRHKDGTEIEVTFENNDIVFTPSGATIHKFDIAPYNDHITKQDGFDIARYSIDNISLKLIGQEKYNYKFD